MNHLLEWNNLDEAANYLTLKSGKEWTPRMVLDVGEKEELIIRFVVPANVKAMAGDTEEWIGDQPALMSNSIAALLREGKAMIGFVPFTDPITMQKTIFELKPRPTITLDNVRIKRKDLETYGAILQSTSQIPSDLKSKEQSKTNKYNGGRPQSIARKGKILSRIIVAFETVSGEKFNTTKLPGSRADLIKSCITIEKHFTGKCVNLRTSEKTFSTWLRSTQYSFGTGRSLNKNKEFWTNRTTETIPFIDLDIFQ